MTRVVDLWSEVVWFEDADCIDVRVAGGKGASLAVIAAADLPVPPGFVVRADALEACLDERGTVRSVRALLSRIDSDASASAVAPRVQALVLEASPRGDLVESITTAYRKLGEAVPVAVRSSARAEDSEAASYAGQQETFLNVYGIDKVLDGVCRCWGSFFAERALFYRRLKGSLEDLGMAVVVQRQLHPSKAGVLFTIDPVRRRRDQMVVEAAWGLGEAVVSGLVIPDHYVVRRDGTLKNAQVALQSAEIVHADGGGTETVPVEPERAGSQVLSKDELQQLAGLGRRLEDVFGLPQDIEWAIEDGRVYLLQSRPVTA